MIKKALPLLLILSMLLCLTACSDNKNTELKIAIITADELPVNEKTGNAEASPDREVWKAAEVVKKRYGLAETTLVQPDAPTSEACMTRIDKLYSAGHRMIIVCGYVFSDALIAAQDKYRDCYFIAADFVPERLEENSAAVFSEDQESAFVAGVAAALKVQEGEAGAVLGAKTDSELRCSAGFQQGVLYANANYGTSVNIKISSFLSVGSFHNESVAQQLAAQLFDSGVNCLLIAAGHSSRGALIEAKVRRASGDDIWAIGTGVDQYYNGIYEGNQSVVLTSAVRYISAAVEELLDSAVNNEFQGGRIVLMNSANNGVGLPARNNNIDSDMLRKCQEVREKIIDGTLTVAAE
ncbi:MAG: BMP family ABC transporter substrate-binding protein [Clostridia bacterium]|nr:BMP family ABC transporter substrate-binding protein [Clostridia bacterium]